VGLNERLVQGRESDGYGWERCGGAVVSSEPKAAVVSGASATWLSPHLWFRKEVL
jgi:hypothetical protein